MTTATSGEESEDKTSTTEASCREIVHVSGTACVPADPVRVIALDPLTVLPTLVAIDASVIATVKPYASGASFVDYLDEGETNGIEIIGSFDTGLSLEKIAALHPDLIIGSISRIEDQYELLNEIAPTVVTGYAFYETNWRDEIRLTADAVGRLDAAEVLLADLDTQIEDTRAALSELAVAPTLTRVDVWNTMPLFYRFGCTWMGDLFNAIGLEQPAAQQGECAQSDPAAAIGFLSLETLDLLEADAVVAYQQQSGADDVGRSPLDTLSESPLWEDLEVVRSGNVYVFGDAWGLGGSVQAAKIILDDLTNKVFHFSQTSD